MSNKDINYTKEAFLHPWNLAFLIIAMLTSFSVSLASGNVTWAFETILLFASALELLYLGIMPRQERFRRAVRSRRAAEHAKPPSQKEIFHVLTKHSQRRYARLRKLGRDIQNNYRKMSYASQGMLDSHVKKINGLLDSYLTLLYQRERYQYSSQATTEADVLRAMEELKTDMSDDPPKVLAIKERRLKILEQRLNRFKKGSENLEIIEAQLETVEDVVKYIHEQSLTLNNPEEITFQLDTLLTEVEETQLAVEEIEEVFAKPTSILGDLDTYSSEQSESTKDRLKE
ncbi:MAG: hypothetical protein HKN43_09415 [Rhodothermales bacterium]|nr:hypothetical protein [Rhodothermales bacterium]